MSDKKQDMALLPERQADMREIASLLVDEADLNLTKVRNRIGRLRKMEQQSAKGSIATIERSEHSHVKKSGEAALRNRRQTIAFLEEAIACLDDGDLPAASVAMTQAANAGGKKSVKAARKTPTVSLYVEYLAETDLDFQRWLAARGVSA